LITLDKEEKTLSSEDMVIVDDNTVIGLAGVMGGMQSGVGHDAKEILMEVAHFNPVSVRKSAKRHGLSTDASKRYEKSLSPQLPVQAMLRAVEILQEMYEEVTCGVLQATIASERKLVVSYDPAIASHLVGQEITNGKEVLERFGFTVDASTTPWQVTVPHFRQGKDINLEMDLVEEVVRAYGYQDIAGVEPEEPVVLPLLSAEQEKQRLLTRLMTGLGYDETQTYSFLDASLAETCLQTIETLIPLANPLSGDHTHLRSSLIPTLLGYVDRSIAESREIQVFELATVFGTQASPCNKKQLVAIKVIPTYKDDPEVLYDMKAVAESLLEYTKVKTQVRELEHDFAHPYRQCQYVQGRNVLAEVFELHPRIIRNFKWKNIVVGIMIFHPEALNLKSLKKASYTAPSAYPATLQGFSVYFPESFLVGDIQAKLQKISPLVESVTITDYYQGEHTPAGQKAVGIEISYRDHNKTLEEQDVTALTEKAKAIITECGGEVRR
jgi:phenylalanyl-tRNA synthetase beta chain